MLVATLGTEPQVLTLCLQELLARGEWIVEAVGVHSARSEPAIQEATERLRKGWPTLEFSRGVSLRLKEVPTGDYRSKGDLVLLYRVLKDVVTFYRERGFLIHLDISGGRKPMGIFSLLVAQLLFGPEDHLWYLISSPELEASRALTAPRNLYRLLEIPVPIWTAVEVFLQALASYEDPWAAVELQRTIRRREEEERWKHFWEGVLTPAERRVVTELVLRGASNKEIARKLGLSSRTVENELRSSYKKLKNFLSGSLGFSVNRATLIAFLAPFFRGFSSDDLGEKPVDERRSPRK